MIKLINKTKLHKWLIFFGILFLFMFADLGIVLIYYYFGGDIYHLTVNESITILLIKYAILIIIFIILYRKYLKEKWFDFKNNAKKYSEISFKNWLIGFIIMVISNFIINSYISGLGQNEAGVQNLIHKIPLIAFLITTLFAPFVEEIIFRKCLQDCFNNKYLYMITSGILFGLVHVIGANNALEYLLIIPYGALGMMFAKTINETDNIYSTILLHMFHNGCLTLLAIGAL